jgi:hypothetical protein
LSTTPSERLKGLGPARTLLVEQRRGFRPFDRFGDAGKLGERLAAQSSDRGDDRARRAFADARRAHHDDAHFALGRRIVDPVIDAAAAQSFVQLARAVGGEDHHRPLVGANGAALRDRNLKVGKKLEQERFEFVIGAVDFVDQQHRLLRAPQTGEHRPLDQKFVAVDVDVTGAFALLAQRQHLARKIPFIERAAASMPS